MTFTKEQVEMMDDDLEDHFVEMLTTPVHERQLVMCETCNTKEIPTERVEDLEDLEEETNTHFMLARVYCSDKCEVIDKL